jgi:two-component system sensor histidine kinase DesK
VTYEAMSGPFGAPQFVTRWARYSPRGSAVFIWCPILLIGPINAAAHADPALAGWLTLPLVAVLYYTAVTSSTLRRAAVSLLAHAAVAVVAVGWLGMGFAPLLLLLAIGSSAALGARWGLCAVIATPLLAGVVTGLTSASWVVGWSSTFTTFLAAVGTYAFYRLLDTITELARTREELAQVAVEQERQRFSRDLHDLLGHTLSLVVVKAEAVRRLVPRDPAAAITHAADIEVIGREALAEVREAVSGYRSGGLAAELAGAARVLDAAGITRTVALPDQLPSGRCDVVFGWVVREGVTNIVRHSGATSCAIRLSASGGGTAERLRLELTDDGRGPGEWTSGGDSLPGNGLRGLQERVQSAGGTMSAGPAPSPGELTGFALAVELPVDPGTASSRS